MPGPVFVEGETVDLRTIEREDAEFLRELFHHPRVRGYAGPDAPDSGEAYESDLLDRMEGADAVELLVCDGDEPVGDVSLAPIDDRRDWANLGYAVHPDYQGEGYATEAARLVVDHGFAALGLHRISATIHADNEASKRVVEKLGFTHEGTKRDDDFVDGEYVDREVYAVLSGEWEG
ncbi:GNAT family N-acetyltransferase [Halosimplex pelagicum]|uniref:GNAT family N-acetyltransferase n=1 Tax=Halosimplex pelagicum TaxID=869886 RepID=A0A7D5TCB0_9EURY|nr:GNAT family protein [Halosimplex pelagicum]QLH84470.1 GNAT family N-acetyltransferase [Halosimplex pelagicum]